MKCSVVALILCLATFCRGGVLKCTPGSKDDACITENTRTDEPLRCKPHTSFKRDCNTCRCLENGLAICTLRGCLSSSDVKLNWQDKEIDHNRDQHSAVKRSAVCKPGSRYKIECNTCICSDDGQSFACTMMGCYVGDINIGDVELLAEDEERISKEETDKPAQNVCKPRRTFNVGCNTCLCNFDGSNYSCTNKPCPLPDDVEIFHELTVTRSVVPSKTVVCAANRMFIKDCNTCWCNEDGTSYFCTRKVCVDDLPEDVSEPVKIHEINGTCRPDEVFELDCNMCRCNPDGLSYSCTRRACPSEEEELPLRRKTRSTSQQISRTAEAPLFARLIEGTPKNCQPGQEFRMDCNKCLCDNEGQNFSCTRIDCAALNSNGNGGARARREVSTRSESGCTPGGVFSRDCNTCRCTEDGGHATCTLKQCGDHKQEYDAKQPEADPDFRCSPGDQFKRDCNDCTCGANGRIVFCTLRLCDHEV